MGTRCTLLRPGIVAYEDASLLQRRIADDVRGGADPTLILLEHPHTYTLGTRGDRAHVLRSDELLRARGAEVIRSDRGGDVTYHGPGQLVGYPIVNLRRRGEGPVAYVRALEATMIDTLTAFGIEAGRVSGRPGVWCGNAKIGAIGVRVSRGVTTHGFGLNVNTDLSYFGHIVPCGIADTGVTSMQEMVGAPLTMRDVEDTVAATFARIFGVTMIEDATITIGVSVGS